MIWLRHLLQHLRGWWHEIEAQLDFGYPDNEPPVDSDFGCPDTQPTSPGALDSDLARLK